MTIRVLVIEDGSEYTDTLGRFLADGFAWARAGSGPEGLSRLTGSAYDVVFLDMRFDRCPPDQLLGDLPATVERHDGDAVAARRFLEDHQGTYVLAAIRDAGHRIPVLLSCDFAGEPRRWDRLASRYPPVAYLGGNAGPGEIAAALRGLL